MINIRTEILKNTIFTCLGKKPKNVFIAFHVSLLYNTDSIISYHRDLGEGIGGGGLSIGIN